MNIQATKIDVVQKILMLTAGDVLEKNNKILDKEMIVGYTAEGKPLTKEAYQKRLQKAEEQIRAGDYRSQEELEKDAGNW